MSGDISSGGEVDLPCAPVYNGIGGMEPRES